MEGDINTTKSPHDERTDYVFHRTSWLIQRSHYFVVGMTFLVAALAVIVPIKNFALRFIDENVTCLMLFLCAFGYSLSFFFMVINHREAIIIAQLQGAIDEDPMTPLFEWADSNGRPETLQESHGPLRDMWHVLPSASERVSQSAPHTYMISFGFCIFWLLLSLIVLPPLRRELMEFGLLMGADLAATPFGFCIFWLRLPFIILPLYRQVVGKCGFFMCLYVVVPLLIYYRLYWRRT